MIARPRWSMATVALVSLAASLSAQQAPTEISLSATRLFPESITSTADGTLIIGSLGHGTVLRIPAGKSAPEVWIKAGTGGLNAVLGVFADEAHGTLWVCSNNLDKKGSATALKSFDLKTAAPRATFPLPGGAKALCNDIAIGADGSAYVSDTQQASIFLLKPGAKALVLAAKDTLLASADGLGFGDPKTIYINGVETNKLLRVDLGADGKATKVTELALSAPLKTPDGMRAIGPNRFLLAEGAGKMDVITIDASGRRAQVQTIKTGLTETTAVTVARGLAWIVEGKLSFMDDKKKDPGTFRLVGVPLPKS